MIKNNGGSGAGGFKTNLHGLNFENKIYIGGLIENTSYDVIENTDKIWRKRSSKVYNIIDEYGEFVG